MNILKLKDRPGQNVANFCDTILVDAERLQSVGAFKPYHLGYIIRIFEYSYDYRLHIWETHKYNEVMEFIKKLFACGKYFMKPDEIITYDPLVQEPKPMISYL